jgi:hypothetical protein
MTRVHIDANGHYAFSGGDTASGGSVATILTKDARRWWAASDRSCGPIEQVGDKGGLAADIMTVNLSNLSLPHHRHGLEARQRLPRRTETAEAEPRPDKALDTPVVLLDDVVIWHV